MNLIKNKPLLWGIIIAVLIIIVIILSLFSLPTDEKNQNLNIMTPEEFMKADVLNLATNYNFSESELESVETIKAYGPDVIPLLADLIKDSHKETRYIAYIALSGLTNLYPDQRSDLISLLKNGLTDTDDTIKVQVAQLILVWGEKDAVPVLINALDNSNVMIPSEPQTTLNYYAHMILVQFTSVDFKYNKSQWQSWWNTNKDKLTWNQELEKFK